MIARIRGFRERTEYVALHVDETSGERWVTVRGDRGASGEQTEVAAIRLCVEALWQRLAPTAEQARQLARACDVRGRPRTERGERLRRELSSELARTLALAGRNLERLLDEPTGADELGIEAELEDGDIEP